MKKQDPVFRGFILVMILLLLCGLCIFVHAARQPNPIPSWVLLWRHSLG